MPTVAEINKEIDALIQKWDSEFTPLVLAVTEIRGIMSERIFGSKSSSGENSAGVKLPTKPYSTKPIYVSTDSLPSTPTQYQVGKRGKRIKSAYFPQGYSELKKAIGRPALELTNQLDTAYTNDPLLINGDKVAIAIDDSQGGKVDGLQKRYGAIFEMTDDEANEFGVILSELLAEAINKQLG